jgi:hypothetical protein
LLHSWVCASISGGVRYLLRTPSGAARDPLLPHARGPIVVGYGNFIVYSKHGNLPYFFSALHQHPVSLLIELFSLSYRFLLMTYQNNPQGLALFSPYIVNSLTTMTNYHLAERLVNCHTYFGILTIRSNCPSNRLTECKDEKKQYDLQGTEGSFNSGLPLNGSVLFRFYLRTASNTHNDQLQG